MSLDDLHDAFHLRLGRLTQAIGQLDLNIGLAVSWLGKHNGTDIRNLIDPAKTGFSMRLNMLKKLVDITADQRSRDKTTAFAHWFACASRLPALNNNYLHAKWSFHRIAHGDEPYVLFKVPDWNHLPDQPDNGTQLSLKAFDQQIEALRQLNHDFSRMCDCRVAHVAPFSGAFAASSAASSARPDTTPVTRSFHARPSATTHAAGLN